ncbi:translation initiation factor IF-2-like [Helianthus annuus]|uniref:translation initiation factor IF-2-like n=1 Tax=Helianthus annuus TaxID=4232 RepID=UPI000B901B60|nr:translation initiation factor IF-2-like [Helianthus annuus]
MIEDKPKSRACAVFHDDEGFDWSQEDAETLSKKHDHYAFIAEIQEESKEKDTLESKEKTREEILSEKTYRERNVVYNRMEDMQEEYEIPLRAEYYRNVMKDDTYAKRLEKEIRYAMTSCLRKRDEERLNKSVEEMVNNLKKVAEEVNTEAVEVEVVKEIKGEEVVVNIEVVKEAVTEEQQVDEEEVRKEEEEEVKNENLEAGDAGDEVSVEETQNVAEMK